MAEVSVKFKVTGFKEFDELLTTIQNDFGPKDTQKILNRAVKLAMTPVLMQAKMLAPVDTGALRESLRIEARRPTTKDRRSRYVDSNDIVIGTVTTAPGNVLAKRSFYNYKKSFKEKRNIKTKGIPSDARANVQEFGSVNFPAQPYLRPALESQGPSAVNSLSQSLKEALNKYQSKKK